MLHSVSSLLGLCLQRKEICIMLRHPATWMLLQSKKKSLLFSLSSIQVSLLTGFKLFKLNYRQQWTLVIWNYCLLVLTTGFQTYLLRLRWFQMSFLNSLLASARKISNWGQIQLNQRQDQFTLLSIKFGHTFTSATTSTSADSSPFSGFRCWISRHQILIPIWVHLDENEIGNIK